MLFGTTDPALNEREQTVLYKYRAWKLCRVDPA